MNWTKTVLLVVVAAVLGASGAYWATRPKSEGSRVSVTVESIRKVAQLATVEYRLSTLIRKTFQSRSGVGLTDSSKMLAYYTGTVKGSVDMEKIQFQLKESDKGAGPPADGSGPRRASIHFARGSIVVKDVALIPGADSMVEEVEWVKTFYQGPNDQQREGVRQEALRKILESAFKSGIVDKTKENARTILTEFLAGFGIAAEVTFDDEAFSTDDPAIAKLAGSRAKH